MQRHVSYEQGKLDAAPNQGGDLGIRLNKGVDHGGEFQDRLKNRMKAVGVTIALIELILTVQLGGEDYDGFCSSDGTNLAEALALIVCQYRLKIVDRVFQ